MMKRFGSQFIQNLIIIVRNHFHWIILLTLATIIVIYHIFPESYESKTTTYFYDASPDKAMESFLIDYGMADYIGFESVDALTAFIGSNRNYIGVVYDVEEEQRTVTLIHNGKPDAKTHNLWKLATEMIMLYEQGELSNMSFQTVALETDPYKMTLKDLLLPIMESFEVMILGFMLVAVAMFQEKEEGSIRAYRVSPGGVWSYILSKAGVWVFLSLIYGTIAIMATHGFDVNWIGLIALIIVGSYFMTVLGMCVAVFFDNMSEWFFIAVTILVINMLPQVSLANPAFSPEWIRILPSYPVMFAVKDALFGTGEVSTIWRTVGLLTAEGVGISLIAYLLIKYKMMKAA